jgi:hypothetical protein
LGLTCGSSMVFDHSSLDAREETPKAHDEPPLAF